MCFLTSLFSETSERLLLEVYFLHNVLLILLICFFMRVFLYKLFLTNFMILFVYFRALLNITTAMKWSFLTNSSPKFSFLHVTVQCTEAVVRRCSSKQVFLKFSCARVSFSIKLHAQAFNAFDAWFSLKGQTFLNKLSSFTDMPIFQDGPEFQPEQSGAMKLHFKILLAY